MSRRYFFVFFTRSTWLLVLSPTNPAQTTDLLIFYFRWREGVPTSVLGSQPIVWLLSSFPSGVRRPKVTKYQHLLISPLWPTFFLTVTFLTGCHCSFQREDSINLISIVSVGYHVTLSTTIYSFICMHICRNLLSFLLWYSARLYEWGTQWESNSLVKVC